MADSVLLLHMLCQRQAIHTGKRVSRPKGHSARDGGTPNGHRCLPMPYLTVHCCRTTVSTVQRRQTAPSKHTHQAPKKVVMPSRIGDGIGGPIEDHLRTETNKQDGYIDTVEEALDDLNVAARVRRYSQDQLAALLPMDPISGLLLGFAGQGGCCGRHCLERTLNVLSVH